MNGYVYILKSDLSRYYVVSTSDVARRFIQHKSGHTHTPHRMNNLELVFTQEFETLEKTRQIERKIKSWKRKDFIEKIISAGFIKME